MLQGMLLQLQLFIYELSERTRQELLAEQFNQKDEPGTSSVQSLLEVLPFCQRERCK
jgi:hypothetical protein